MIRDESGNALFSTRACYYMREDYPAMMGMTFKTGRMARTEDEVIVNETFADMMHWGMMLWDAQLMLTALHR